MEDVGSGPYLAVSHGIPFFPPACGSEVMVKALTALLCYPQRELLRAIPAL